MITCAEGVETEEQVAYLRQEGCTEVQGYYYGKPAPVHDAIRLLNSELAKAGDGGSARDTALKDRPEAAHQPKPDASNVDPVAAYITAVATSVET
jgi:predicted signal transduction protein with EAL and GGDEF domain